MVETIQEDLLAMPQDTGDSPLERHDLVTIAAEADGRIEAVKKIIITALKVTNPNDWVKQGYGDNSRPYLCASGAEKIAHLFNVRISDINAEKISGKDDRGEYYFYAYTCKASLPGGHMIEAEGTCSSRDQFFAQAGKDAEGKPIYKPASEVDETNIRKAAHSNMVVRSITSLLGLRNLSWAQLQAAGIDMNAAATVEYGRRNGSSLGSEYISEAQRRRLFAIQQDKKVSEVSLKDYLGVNYGVSKTTEIKKADYEKIVAWVERGGK